MANFTYSVSFTNKNGVLENFTTGGEISEFADARRLLLATISEDVGPKFNAPAGKPEPMMAAAAASGFVAPGAVPCPNGCGPKRHVAGGISAKTKRPYPAFDTCDTCGHKENSPK